MNLESCRHCGHRVPETATSCPSCGAHFGRPRGVDSGFHFLYWGLSYRRKFVRTLWLLSLSPILLLFPKVSVGHIQLGPVGFISTLVVGVAQLIYTYAMWKKLEG